MWRDEAILTFVDRLTRDSEFREWFVHTPDEALASYGLKEADLQYLDRALNWSGSQRAVAEAMRPFVRMLIDAAAGRAPEPELAYARLTTEIGDLKGRVA